MNYPVPDRIRALRKAMEDEKLDALYISGTDPHMSEYLCDHWKNRTFITGFSGSYGEVVVTHHHAGLWTDTRYFLQAAEELDGTGVTMHHLRVPGAIPVSSWLPGILKPGDRVGVDPFSLPLNTFRLFQSVFEEKKIETVFVPHLLNGIWYNRPPIKQNPVFELDDSITGVDRIGKAALMNGVLDHYGADITLITALDDLAWTFNLRGSDIPYNPLFFGFATVGKNENRLFVRKTALSPELTAKLQSEGTIVSDYSAFYPYLFTITGKTVYLDPNQTNTKIWSLLGKNCHLIEGTSIPSFLKSVKNETELQGFRSAMKKDGAALVTFLYWLESVSDKSGISEYSTGRKLAEFRAMQPGFMGESFVPTVGYRGHGAVVHYHADETTAYNLSNEGILLFDSGGHYLTGTTDITRTVAIGPVTDQQKADFTLALRGMIGLSMAIFPEGTKGVHLDILARHPLWKAGLNYGHGTGHGVGHFLNVHEGPASIRQEYNPQEIRAGMVFSNEPGIYREGEYGVRTENMMVCVEKQNTEFGRFLGFETLTLCPVDTSLIIPGLMTEEEKAWLNNYHLRVRKELAPLLTDLPAGFLEKLTRVI